MIIISAHTPNQQSSDIRTKYQNKMKMSSKSLTFILKTIMTEVECIMYKQSKVTSWNMVVENFTENLVVGLVTFHPKNIQYSKISAVKSFFQTKYMEFLTPSSTRRLISFLCFSGMNPPEPPDTEPSKALERSLWCFLALSATR